MTKGKKIEKAKLSPWLEDRIKERIFGWTNKIAPGARIAIPLRGVRGGKTLYFEKDEMVEAIYKIRRLKRKTYRRT